MSDSINPDLDGGVSDRANCALVNAVEQMLTMPRALPPSRSKQDYSSVSNPRYGRRAKHVSMKCQLLLHLLLPTLPRRNDRTVPLITSKF